MRTTTLPVQRLQDLAVDIFFAVGSSRAESQRIAQYLVGANLTGHDSHGVIRIPRYVQMKRDGLLVADQKVSVVSETPVLAVLDAKRGYGQTVGPQAVKIGIDNCKAMGLSAVTLRNAGHLGRIGDWAEMAASAGLVSIHFVNGAGSVFVAPFGSVERRFSTAPYCVGVPLPGRSPVVLDFATSLVAEGKVLVASQGGAAIPADALIGPNGQTSDDTRLIYGDFPSTGKRDFRQGKGAIRAFGEHKGSGLALMCELLGGALTGNGCSSREGPFANGMLSIYLDPEKLDPESLFPPEATRYIAWIKSARPDQPGGETLVPGEPEERARKQRLAEGIPLAEETWQSILDTAKLVGIGPPH